MPKQTPKTLFLFKRLSLLVIPVILLVASVVAMVAKNTHVEAATNSTINFQARLLTAAGAVVPDGDYNVEFKLYNASSSSGSSQGSCTGDTACLWVETRTTVNRVRVVNGYLTVNLGSVTAFGSIAWDQELWLAMNVGGTTGPTWDGEMSPRLKLTGVPYAFRAGKLVTQNGANTSTLDFAAPTGNRTITIPDESGTLCVQGATTCGFIKNGTTQQTGNFNILSAGTGSIGAVIQGASGQTADLLNINDGAGALKVGVNSSGKLSLYQAPATSASQGALEIGSTAAQGFGDINGVIGFLGNGVGHAEIAYSVGDGFYLCDSSASSASGNYGQCADRVNLYAQDANFNGTATVKNTSALALQVQNALSINTLVVDTSNGQVDLGDSGDADGKLVFRSAANTNTLLLNPATTLTANRTITLPDEDGIVCIRNSANCGFVAGTASSYIQNQNASSQATANFWIDGTGRADTALQSPLFDTATAGALAIGTTNATAVNLNKNTTVASGQTFTVTSGATSLTGANTGDALTVSNSISTGNVAVFKDNTTNVLTIADGGATTFLTTVNSSTALRVQDSAGNNVLRVSTGNGAILTLGRQGVGSQGHIANVMADVHDSGSVSTAVFDYNKNVPSGHTVVVSLAVAAVSYFGVTSITDTASNTYTLDASHNFGSTATVYVFSVRVTNPITAGDQLTITLGTGYGRWAITAEQFDNFLTSPVDQTAVNGASSATNLTSGVTATTTQADELVFGAFGFGTGRIFTEGSGYTLGTQIGTNGGSSDREVATEWKSVTATGTQEATGTLSSAGTYAAAVVTYKTSGEGIIGKAGSIGLFDGGTTGYTVTLSPTTLSANRTITIPNESGTLCLQGSASCGFELAGGGGSGIQNGTTVQTNANFNIRSAATGSVTGVLQGANGQTADILQVQTWNGASNATVFSVGSSGQVLAKSTTTAAFNVQNASGTSFFLVDTSGSSIKIGDASTATIVLGGVSDNMTLTYTGGAGNYEPVLNGNARHTRRVTLSPEFAGAVLTAQNGCSTCSGSMTSDTEPSAGASTLSAAEGYAHNYYAWTTTQASNQNYDIWVSYTMPSDFVAFANSSTPFSVWAKTTNTTSGTVTMQVFNGTRSPAYCYGSGSDTPASLTPSTANTWQEATTGSMSCTLAANERIWIRFRLQAPQNGITRLGELRFDYLSKW